LKEEIVLELEVDMEDRLEQFKNRKEDEVASQLERQLDKREEIMRNKALIEVRKREALIRSEIEAQLGLKRAEIRDRLQNITKQMDNFKENAEIKMRDAVEKQVQGEIDSTENEYTTREKEFRDLQNTDSRAEKRQMWMQSISGQDRPQNTAMPDPSLLGARPSLLGSSGGRPMRGILSNEQPQQPRMGLAGMRAPETSSKPLAPSASLVRPVKSPLVTPTPAPTTVLPKPVQKMGTAELRPVVSTLQPQEPETVVEVEQNVTTTTTLTPITTTLTPQAKPTANVARLTPIKHMLEPVKKSRGSPPPSSLGKNTDDSEENEE